MTDLRTAAQQALEVLENAEDQLAKPYSTDASNAITALRAALAQQAEPVQPYAWHYTNNGGASVWHRGPSNRLDADMQAARDYPHVHKVTPLYTAPHQAEPVQGPFALPCPTPKACREHCCHGACLPAPQQAEPKRNFCPRCGKRLSSDGIHTCTPPQTKCSHCASPLFAALQCRVCGRKAEPK